MALTLDKVIGLKVWPWTNTLTYYEEHVLFGLNQIYYWVLKCTTCYHYTNIIKSGLIILIKIGNIFTTEKGLAL
jgi:hypothetical protein